jgi:hypothetical protein
MNEATRSGFLTRSARMIVALAVFVLPAAFPLCAAPADEKLVAESTEAIERADPFMGDWQGTFTRRNKKTSPLAAQVIALGKGRYHATFLAEFDKRTTPIAGLEGVREGEKVSFMGWGDVSDYCGPDWDGVIENGKFTGSVPAREGGTFELRKVVRISPTLGEKPPAGAIVVFDGKNFDELGTPPPRAPRKPTAGKGKATADKSATEKPAAEKSVAEKSAPAKPAGRRPSAETRRGELEAPMNLLPVKWELVNGAMRCTKGAGSVVTKRRFGAFKMHLEFRTPFMPEAREQSRGNSGVIFHGLEIQVLDTYGLGGRSKECGAVYSRVAPLVNACAPPMQWQTYDVTIQAPEKGANARLTVLQNGVTIHDNLEVGPISTPSSILLQDHGNTIEYRNIWVVELP